jgi:dCTP deaminase
MWSIATISLGRAKKIIRYMNHKYVQEGWCRSMKCLLPDHQIKSYVKDKKLIIEPFDTTYLEPASYDLRVGNSIISITNGGQKSLSEGKFIINPGELILVETLEKVAFPDFLQGRICSKVTLLQKGLSSIATKIDPGYGLPRGWPLLLVFHHYGHEVIKLDPGQPVCSVEIELLESPAEKPYTPKGPMKVSYSRSEDPLAKLKSDFRNVNQDEIERFHGHPIDDIVLAIGKLQKNYDFIENQFKPRSFWKTVAIVYGVYIVLAFLLSFDAYILRPSISQNNAIYTIYFGIAAIIGVLLGFYKNQAR